MKVCSFCGGSGELALSKDGQVTGDCRRCEGMPKLPKPFSLGEALYYGAETLWFKPDPDSIIYLHRATAHEPWQQLYTPRICFHPPGEDVGCGWVERPTRLETVE